jgi:hypothetical protein
MADPVNFNPNAANGTFGFEEWNAGTYDFVMDGWNKIFAFKYKTPAFGAAKTVDKLWLYVPRIVGDPRWMIQFFANDVDDNSPTANTFLGALHGAPVAAVHRDGLDIVKGWNIIQVNGSLKNNGYPYSAYPTTIVALTLSASTEYWILVAPQKDTAEGTSKSNTKNYAVSRSLANYYGPLYKTKTLYSKDRAAHWGGSGLPNPYFGNADGEGIIAPFIIEYTDGTTKHGFPYIQTGWKGSYDAKPGYDVQNPLGIKWRQISNTYRQQQLFVAPGGLGTVKQLEFRAIWGTPVMPTHDLKARLFPAAGGADLFNETVCPRNAQFLKEHPNTNYARVRVIFDTGFTLTGGTSYVLEFFSDTDDRKPWWAHVFFTGTTTSVVRGIKFGGASTFQHRAKVGAATAEVLSTQDSDMTFTLATIPSTLTGIAAVHQAGRKNHVTWNASGDSLHSHYKVFRKKSTQADSEFTMLADGVTSTFFDDYALASGVLYQYRVVDVRS